MSILTYIAGWPLLAALVLVLVPRNYRVIIRAIALLGTFISMMLAIKMFCDYSLAHVDAEGYRFVQQIPWVESLGISYHVGVDGLNVGLILMGAIVAFAAACCAWEIQSREKEFYILLLVMSGGILGAFASLDLFFFYFLHELALVPTFIMIGIWGRGERKNYATFQITLYLSIGALIALIGLIALYLASGASTFDIPKLIEHAKANPLSASAQNFIFPLLLFGFGILVSLWPFHSWAPLGYGSAPAPTAMIHAGVLKKFGLYGLIRIALPLMPQAMHTPVMCTSWLTHFPLSLLPAAAQHWLSSLGWLHILALLCLGNILYVGWVAMRQKDLNLLIGNSSVAHMGFVFLGIASLNLIGVTGAVIIMIAHGFLAALTFALSGYIYQKTGTLEMSRLGGLCRQIPFIGTALLMAALAGCGLPGFANFVGEVTVFFGAWTVFPTLTALAVWGALLIAALYMLRAMRNVLHGPVPEDWSGVPDASHAWRKLPYALLLASLFMFGVWPRLLTDKITPDAQKVVAMATAKTDASALAVSRSSGRRSAHYSFAENQSRLTSAATEK